MCANIHIHVCIYIYIYKRIYVCTCMCVCLYTHTHTHTHAHMHIYIYIYIYMCVCVCVYVNTYNLIYIYIYVCIYVCMYVYKYMYLCIYLWRCVHSENIFLINYSQRVIDTYEHTIQIMYRNTHQSANMSEEISKWRVQNCSVFQVCNMVSEKVVSFFNGCWWYGRRGRTSQ